MSPSVAACFSAETPGAGASTRRAPALADRATQVIALTARLWGLRPGVQA